MGKIGELKEKAREYFDDEVLQRVRDDAAMRIRSDPRILKRWMEYTHAERPEDIDYSDPCVMIEFQAADPTVLAMAEDMDRFVAFTGCDRETFRLHYWPDGPAEEP